MARYFPWRRCPVSSMLYIVTAMLVGVGLYDLGLSWMLAAGIGAAIFAIGDLCEDIRLWVARR